MSLVAIDEVKTKITLVCLQRGERPNDSQMSWFVMALGKGPGAVGCCTRPCLIYSLTNCTVSPAPSSLSARHTKLFTTKHMFTPPAFALKAVYCNLNIFSYPLSLENSYTFFRTKFKQYLLSAPWWDKQSLLCGANFMC